MPASVLLLVVLPLCVIAAAFALYVATGKSGLGE